MIGLATGRTWSIGWNRRGQSNQRPRRGSGSRVARRSTRLPGQAREFRQWLREFVTARMGKPLRATAAAVALLNELLARDSCFQRVEADGRDAEDGRRLLLRRVHRWERPGELLQPIAEAAAGLICNRDFRLLRSC